MSSKLTIASSSAARRKSSAGTSLAESMTLSPRMPSASASMSSVALEQSRPQPYSPRMEMSAGLGFALTAKYSRKPGFQAKASRTASMLRRMPASSYRWNGVGKCSQMDTSRSFVTKGVLVMEAPLCG